MHPTLTAPSDRALPRDPLLWAAMAIYIVVIGGLSLARYAGFNAGILDLGSMFQAIASVTRGEPLMVTTARGNVSRLAGHVELIYYAFAPMVALWPDPRVLLVGQTLLAATGAVPAYRLALRRLDSPLAARCAALIYLLYPVALTAALFDFHGDTLAMPLLLWAIDAFDRHDGRAATVLVALSLLCKVYVALPVAAIGAYLFLWGGQRRAGIVTGIAAVIYGAAIFLVVRPLFEAAGGEQIANNYVQHYFGELNEIVVTGVQRLLVALIVVGPVLLLAWRGWRWLLLAAPLIGAVLISTGPGTAFHYGYHHYALAVPFLVMAAIDGAARLRARAEANAPVARAAPLASTLQIAAPIKRPRSWGGDMIFTTLLVGLVSALLVDIPLNPTFWMGLPSVGLDPSAYGITARDQVKERFLAAHVPPGAPLAASVFLGTHVANRDTLFSTRYSDDPGGERLPTIMPHIDYALADALFDWRAVANEQVVAGIEYETREIALLLRNPDFALTAERDGLLLLSRGAAPGAALRQEISAVDQAALPARPADFGPLRLLGARIEPLGGRRYRASFEWQLSGTQPLSQNLVAVSRLEGVAGARVVHLPSYVLLPTSEWLPGQIIRERFDLELPDDLASSSYRWLTAWYSPSSSDAYATDERSRLPGTVEAEVATLEIK
ncbi:MAG: DUF2079 domain-containing protein [Chloroflexales bacterium]|nr:DUF2079 domain-containing protein [Chloroflexales bacterium]